MRPLKKEGLPVIKFVMRLIMKIYLLSFDTDMLSYRVYEI